jgi:hypothetical protein
LIREDVLCPRRRVGDRIHRVGSSRLGFGTFDADASPRAR